MWESLAPNLHQAGLLEIGVGNLLGENKWMCRSLFETGTLICNGIAFVWRWYYPQSLKKCFCDLQGPTVGQKAVHLGWNLNLGFCNGHSRLVIGSCISI